MSQRNAAQVFNVRGTWHVGNVSHARLESLTYHRGATPFAGREYRVELLRPQHGFCHLQPYFRRRLVLSQAAICVLVVHHA